MTIRMSLIFTLCALSIPHCILAKKQATPATVANPVKKVPLRRRQALVIRKKKAEHKTMSHMDFNELEVLKQRLVAEKNYTATLKAIEKQEKKCTKDDDLATLTLEKADLHLKLENYALAGELYRSFIDFYPGNPHVAQAHRLAIKCFKARTLNAERDQSNTLVVIDLCDKYLEHSDLYTELDEVKKTREECYSLLAQSEINVFQFYVQRGKFLSAQTRLDNIKQDYLKELPHLEPILLTLDIDLAQAQNKPDLIKEKQLELEQKYPTIQAVNLAANAPKKKYADRF